MRLNTALLLVGALPGLSVADGVVRRRFNFARQAFANTTTPVESGTTLVPSETATTAVATTSTTSSPSGTSSVDLSDAVLTNAAIIEVDGKPAVLMTPPANGEASIVVNADAPETSAGQGVSCSFDLTATSSSTKHKRAATDCTLAVVLDGQTVYNETIDDNAGAASTIDTDAVYTSSSPLLQIIETCGDDPVPVVISNVQLVAAAISSSSSSSTVLSTSAPTSSGTVSGNTTEPVTSGSAPITTGPVTTPASSTATGTDTATTSGSATASGVVPTETAGFPGLIGDFAFFGCVGSVDNFPTFSLFASSEYMDLEMCTSYCGNQTFAGVYDGDCYCGTQIDGALTERVPTGQCDIPCPGDDSENCGGIRPDSALARRQAAIPNTILLTVYININLPATTVTATVTAVTTIVSTASAGDVVTVTSAIAPSSTTIICVGGYCGFWTFVAFPGADCSGELVYVIETCSCEGGWTYQPKICTGDSCVGITVYKPVECTNTTTAVGVCAPAACDSCEGGVYFTQTPGAATATLTAIGGTPTGSSGTGSGSGGSGGSGSGSGETTAVVVSQPSSTIVTAGSDRVAATLGFLAPALFALVLLY